MWSQEWWSKLRRHLSHWANCWIWFRRHMNSIAWCCDFICSDCLFTEPANSALHIRYLISSPGRADLEIHAHSGGGGETALLFQHRVLCTEHLFSHSLLVPWGQPLAWLLMYCFVRWMWMHGSTPSLYSHLRRKRFKVLEVKESIEHPFFRNPGWSWLLWDMALAVGVSGGRVLHCSLLTWYPPHSAQTEMLGICRLAPPDWK